MSYKGEGPDDPLLLTESIDPIEGTSAGSLIDTEMVDEKSNDSTTSTCTSNITQSNECEKCQAVGVLKVFKQRTPMNGKTEDIYRNHCENCQLFFGMFSKKVRGVFTQVTEEGRILTNLEKMEYLREQKKNQLVSRKNSEQELSISESSTNGVSEEKDAEEYIPEEEHSTVSASANTPIKKIPGGGRRKKKNNWSSVKNKSKKKEARKNGELYRRPVAKKKEPEIRPPVEERKKSNRNSTSNTSKPTGKGSTRPCNSEIVCTEAIKQMASVEVQTDTELLLKSEILEDTVNKTIEKGLSAQIAARLKEQPVLLRKQFVLMLRTIQEQETLIKNYTEMQSKYDLAVKNMKEFGRNIRLTYSDDLRNIRGDMLEMKEEFKAHQSETVSILKKQRQKYEGYKKEMLKKYNDFQLEKTNLEAKVGFLEEEKKYEHDRAEFFLRTRDVYEKEREEAVDAQELAEKRLDDRLYVADNEKCSKCKVVEKLRKQMTRDVADMMEKSEKAIAEKNEMVDKALKYEMAAQNLGRECDTIKYERDSWKSYAEKFKKDVTKLTQNLKEKEKELNEKTAELLAVFRSGATPRSVAATPNGETERVSPEEGEIVDTPPQNSPAALVKPTMKPLSKQIIEKKMEAPKIASGFSSWIPRDKLDAPAPEIPKAHTAFGPPIKTPQQKEAEKPKIGPNQLPTPWEKATAPNNQGMSDSLTEALVKVQADTFFGVTSSQSHQSRAYLDEITKVMGGSIRKRTEPTPAATTGTPAPNSSPAPPVKKQKATPPVQSSPYKKIAPANTTSAASVSSASSSSTPSSAIGSIMSIKKIPKLSEKPPQAEFAPALGIREEQNEGVIPGLGGLEETNKRIQPPIRPVAPTAVQPAPVKAEPTKAPPLKPQQKSPPKKKHIPPKKPRQEFQANPWGNQPAWGNSGPPRQMTPHKNHYGIQSNQPNNFASVDFNDYDRPWTGERGRNGNEREFGALPWHRTQETPFGRVPIQDNFSRGPSHMIGGGGPSGPRPPSGPMGFYNSGPVAGPPGYYPPRPQNRFSPPVYPPTGGGNPRPFYG